MKFLEDHHDRIALIAGILILLLELVLYAKLQHLPGPMYGGDLYAHLGFTKNFVNNNFWTDPYFIGEVPHYPWLGNAIIAFVSLITGLGMLKAMIYTPILITAFSLLGYYLFGTRFFKSKRLGLVVMLMSFFTRGIPDAAPNLTAWTLIVPYLFYFWLRYEESRSMKDAAFTGVFLGLLSLTQVAFFISATSLFVAGIIVKRWEDFAGNLHKEHGYAKRTLTHLAVIALIGVAISMLFYAPILVKYHAHVINPLFTYNGPDINTLGVTWMLSGLFNAFVNLTGVVWFIYGIVGLIGLVACVGNVKKPAPRLAIVFLAVGSLLPLHHLITRPLFGTWVLPGHLFALAFPLLLFFTFGINLLASLAAGAFKLERWVVLAAFMAIILILLVPERINTYNNDRWVQYGRQIDPITQAWLDTGAWIEKDTDKNAVFLTGDETCFAMNGVSGRKCVFVRRTHANYFVDVERRYADGIVMLYGNDTQTTQRLLAQYKVDYVLLDPYLFQSYMKVQPQYETYLKENGVQFFKGRDRLDPAVPDAAQFDLLIVPAQNISAVLMNRTHPATMILAGGQPTIQILGVDK